MARRFRRWFRHGWRPVSNRSQPESALAPRRVWLTVCVLLVLAVAAVLAVAVDLISSSAGGAADAVTARLLTSSALTAAALGTAIACWERGGRSAPGTRRWFRMLAVAGPGMFWLQSLGLLFIAGRPGPYLPLIDAAPMVICGGFVLTAIAALSWPIGMESVERRAVLSDTTIGALGLVIVWLTLVVPALPVADTGITRAISLIAWSIEFAGVVLMLGLAAAARRRGRLPIKQLIGLQFAVLLYVGADALAEALPWGDRATSVTLGSVGAVAAASIAALVALRPADERESARQLWLRDTWAMVLPLSPIPIAAGVLLFLLLAGAQSRPAYPAAIAGMLLVIIVAVLWLRLSARAQVRRASVTVAATTFSQATDQPWFQALVQNSRDVVVVVDRRNRLIYASPSLCDHLGVSLDEIRGRDLTAVFPQLSRDVVQAGQQLPDRPASPVEVTLVDAAGVDHDLQFTVAALAGLGAEGFVLTGQDITDARRMRVLLGESRRRDPLTGLLNNDAFAGAVAEAQRWADPLTLAVLVVDVCDFRSLLDAHGRATGDAALRRVAVALEQAAGPVLAVGRLGPDRFAALLRDPSPDTAVVALVGELRGRLAGGRVTTSAPSLRLAAGYATAFSETEPAVDLVEQADLAAARSLRTLGLSVVRFEHAMRSQLLAELRQVAVIEAGLSTGQFVPFYQPILDLQSNAVVAVEALARRRAAAGGVDLPESFIPVAERVGLVSRIDAAVREAALGDLPVLQRIVPGLSLSLNVTPGSFDVRSAAELAAAVRAAGVATNSVVFEFTESTVATSAGLASAVVAQLHAAGCLVALDDFGSGFSSLGGLRNLPVDVLKIDQMFTQELGSSPRAIALLRAIVDVGRGLGIRTVAEGVRTVEQADLLRGMGADRAQGYLFAEPMPLAELQTWLRGRDPHHTDARIS